MVEKAEKEIPLIGKLWTNKNIEPLTSGASVGRKYTHIYTTNYLE